MNKHLIDAKTALDNARTLIDQASAESKANKKTYKLTELSEYIDDFCKKTNTTKGDICDYAGISKNTLTAALKSPDKATMNTILAIGTVTGFEVLISGSNG